MANRESTWWCEMHQTRSPLDGHTRPVDDENAPTRSEEDLEVVKGFWGYDPSWDLYCATGYEHHRLELLDHQETTESLFEHSRDIRVKACDAVLDVGLVAAGAVESEARTLRRLIVEARDEVAKSIMASGLLDDRDGVPKVLEDSIESHIESAVVAARKLERPEDSFSWLKNHDEH